MSLTAAFCVLALVLAAATLPTMMDEGIDGAANPGDDAQVDRPIDAIDVLTVAVLGRLALLVETLVSTYYGLIRGRTVVPLLLVVLTVLVTVLTDPFRRPRPSTTARARTASNRR